MGSAAKGDPHILQQQIAVGLQELQDEINCSFDQNQGQFALANNWFVKEEKKKEKKKQKSEPNNSIFTLQKEMQYFPACNICCVHK